MSCSLVFGLESIGWGLRDSGSWVNGEEGYEEEADSVVWADRSTDEFEFGKAGEDRAILLDEWAVFISF